MRYVAFLVTAIVVVGCGGPLASVLPTLPARSSEPTTEASPSAAAETAAPTPTEEATPTAEVTETPAATETAEATPEATETPVATGTPPTSPSAPATESAEPTGETVEVIAGGGLTPLANGITATDALLQRPTGIASVLVGGSAFPTANTYVVDGNLGQAFRLTQDGMIDNLANGLVGPQGIAIAPQDRGSGTVYIADTANNRVASPNGNGGVSSVVGDTDVFGYHGDGGPAKRAWLLNPLDVAADSAGLYIADTANQRIRFVDSSTGEIKTVAGNGTESFTGDGGPALTAALSDPSGVAVDPANTKLYIVDVGNRRIRMVTLATGVITTIAGTGDGTAIPYDAGLTGLEVPLSRLGALAIDSQGRLYFQQFWGDRGPVIERLDPATGKLTLIVGGGPDSSPGVAPTEFALGDVLGIAIDPVTGDLLFCQSDTKVYRVNGVAPPA
jgi:sugar lactone lactonase YvrE